MTTKVYRVYCTAGTPITRSPDTPRKMITVQFLDDTVQGMPSVEAQRKAIEYGRTLLRNEILSDPQFKSGFGWEARREEVDISEYEYATPNLQTARARAWFN